MAAAAAAKPELKKEADSDSSDIQILSEHEESDDDPDNSGMHTNDKLNSRTSDGKVIINISEKRPDELIYVADSIQGVIKPHQIGGVRFLYDNIIGMHYSMKIAKITFAIAIGIISLQNLRPFTKNPKVSDAYWPMPWVWAKLYKL